MFNLLGVTVLQPESTISARLPGGAGSLASLVEALRGELQRLYASHTESGARSLSIAFGPEGQLELWLASEDEQHSLEEQNRVQALASRLSPPEVQHGPVALALVYAVGDEAPAEAQLTLPDAWRVVLQASDSPLNVEQILTRVWSITPH